MHSIFWLRKRYRASRSDVVGSYLNIWFNNINKKCDMQIRIMLISRMKIESTKRTHGVMGNMCVWQTKKPANNDDDNIIKKKNIKSRIFLNFLYLFTINKDRRIRWSPKIIFHLPCIINKYGRRKYCK